MQVEIVRTEAVKIVMASPNLKPVCCAADRVLTAESSSIPVSGCIVDGKSTSAVLGREPVGAVLVGAWR